MKILGSVLLSVILLSALASAEEADEPPEIDTNDGGSEEDLDDQELVEDEGEEADDGDGETTEHPIETTTTSKHGHEDDDDGLSDPAKAGLISFFTLAIMFGIGTFVYCKWIKPKHQNSYTNMTPRFNWARTGSARSRNSDNGNEGNEAVNSPASFNTSSLQLRGADPGEGLRYGTDHRQRGPAAEEFQLETNPYVYPYRRDGHISSISGSASASGLPDGAAARPPQDDPMLDLTENREQQPATLVDVSGMTVFEDALRQTTQQPPVRPQPSDAVV